MRKIEPYVLGIFGGATVVAVVWIACLGFMQEAELNGQAYVKQKMQDEAVLAGHGDDLCRSKAN